MFLQKIPQQILLRTILTERAFICKQLSPGMLLQFFQKLLVFLNICFYMHISKPRTRFTTSNEVVYLNPDLHRTCISSISLSCNPCCLKKGEMNFQGYPGRNKWTEVSLAEMVLGRSDREPLAALSVTLAYDFGNVLVPS